MPKYLTQKEAFMRCEKEGKLIPIDDIDIEQIKSMLEISKSDFDSAEALKKTLSKESKQWSSAYKLYYDAIHELVEAFIRFDKVKSENHQCLFALLVEKHKELDLDWDFFEKIRTKRNGISYYGKPVTQEDVKDIKVQLGLYMKTLRKAIDKNIKEYEKAA